jgi:UDP-glucose 4-epimerase
MTVLVTGGAGYIGSHAVRALKKSGFKTLVLDNLIYGHAEFVEPDELIKGDLADVELLDRVFQSNKIEAVLHFAAYAYVGESVSNPSKYYHNNVGCTLNLLDAMVKYHVNHIIFSSTCASYGEPIHIPIDERHPQQPINPYGRSKLMVEQILEDYDRAYMIKSVRLRYFNAAGADTDGGIGEDHNPETHLIPLILDVAINNRPHISIFGTDYDTPDGTCIRDYIHVSDLAEAHVLALKYLQNGGETDYFNLGNGNGFSVKEVIDVARKVTGKEIPAVYADRRPGDPGELVGSSKKIKEVLGWSPKFANLETIIQTAWQWHKTRFTHDTCNQKY